MLLSEGQMSDYKGAAMMLDALPKAKAMLGDRGYDADWFRKALGERGIVACILQSPTARYPYLTTGRSIASATKSKTCSEGSRTGDASTPATIDALTPSCPPSPSPLPSSSGYEQ